MNRRELTAGLGLLTIAALAPLASTRDAVKVTWDSGASDLGADVVGTMEVPSHGMKITLFGDWEHGNVEEMDAELTRMCGLFKKALAQIGMEEYGAVVDNSTSDFYYE